MTCRTVWCGESCWYKIPGVKKCCFQCVQPALGNWTLTAELTSTLECGHTAALPCLAISFPYSMISRSASPKHGFTIMNRLSMENRTDPISKDLDFQLQDPFLLTDFVSRVRVTTSEEGQPETHN